MAVDLSPLERAAARAGRVGLTARLVPHDRRRGDWFRVQGRELLVSEQLVERCPPEDAAALCMNEMLRRRRVDKLRALVVAGPLGLLALFTFRSSGEGLRFEPPFFGWDWRLALFVLAYAFGLFAWWASGRAQAALAADDETVERLGDATPLVRGLNFMDQDELRIAGRRLSARPDLHKRAERLVAKHRLCAPPELR